MRKKLIVGLALLFISGLTFFRMLRPGYYPMHDDMQAMRLLQMHQCVVDGQIPCRWVPDMGFGYGYPQFNYYAPLPYYVMEVFHLLGFSILTSVKIGFLLSTLVGVFGMYLLASSLWGKWSGIISASFFALMPYRSTDMWVRGAVGELWGLAFFPFIFFAIKKTVNRDKNSEMFLALSLAGLLTSHNISTMIFLPFAALWASYLLYQKYGFTPLLYKLRNIRNLTFGFVWGFLISAFFIIPAWIEKNLVKIESLTGGYFDYRQHFVSISKLFVSNYWNFGSSQPGRYDEVYLGVGLIQWSVALISLLVLVFLKRRKSTKTVFVLVALAFVATFMAHSRSEILWRTFGLLKYVQFPWRFLLISSFLFSLTAGSLVEPIKSKDLQVKKITIILLGLVIFFNASYFKPLGWLDTTDSEKFSGDEWLSQQTISIYDYLPKTVGSAPNEPAPLQPAIVSGDAEFSEVEKGSDWYRVKVNVLSDGFTMRLPIYYFPNWKVETNGIEENISYNNKLGLITFNLSEGVNQVYAKLSDTFVRKASNFISLFAIIYIPVFLRRRKKELRKQ